MYEVIMDSGYTLYANTPNSFKVSASEPIGMFLTDGEARIFGQDWARALRRKNNRIDRSDCFTDYVIRQVA